MFLYRKQTEIWSKTARLISLKKHSFKNRAPPVLRTSSQRSGLAGVGRIFEAVLCNIGFLYRLSQVNSFTNNRGAVIPVFDGSLHFDDRVFVQQRIIFGIFFRKKRK